MDAETQAAGEASGGKRGCCGAPLLVLAVVAVCVGAYAIPRFLAARAEADQATCHSTLKQLAVATEMYAADHSGRLPSSAGWYHAMTGYIGQPERYPEDHTDQPCSYAMSSRWSGAILRDIAVPSDVVLLYEADYGRPSYRHHGGLNVAFAEGTVRWISVLPPGDIGGPPSVPTSPPPPSPPAPRHTPHR